MKPFSIILLFLVFNIQNTIAQTTTNHSDPLDTLYANTDKNVALVFPSSIQQGITGTDSFIFSYSKDKPQRFGLLQARPGKESNLLVISANGSIFSYIVKYKESLKKVNYFFKASDRVGRVRPKSMDSTKTAERKQHRADSTYYARFASYLLKSDQKIGHIRKRKHGIILRVKNIVFDKDEFYFVIQVKNKSSLDYDLDLLRLSLETRKGGKKKSAQRLYKNPLLTYKKPDRVHSKSTVTMVYVFPKFSLGKDHRTILRIQEKHGERDVKLKITKHFINNPN